jgi:hypothetical protein
MVFWTINATYLANITDIQDFRVAETAAHSLASRTVRDHQKPLNLGRRIPGFGGDSQFPNNERCVENERGLNHCKDKARYKAEN